MFGFLGPLPLFRPLVLTFALFADGEWGYATLNIVLSVVLCLVAVWIAQLIALQVVRG
jgi:fluoride ion exporter CrcB/FEX